MCDQVNFPFQNFNCLSIKNVKIVTGENAFENVGNMSPISSSKQRVNYTVKSLI